MTANRIDDPWEDVGEAGNASEAVCRLPEDPERRRQYLIALRGAHAFYRDLPRLLEERPGQWVAYHGDQQIGFARTQYELDLEGRRRGIPDEEFVVYCIEGRMPGEVLPPLPPE